jgi:HD-GYP domain-containing protein (c-di-GMP phosphodiesterase class II)
MNDASSVKKSLAAGKRISSHQLRPGMYLVGIVDSWWKSPFFLHRRVIQNFEEIQLLIQAGIQEVEIDPERGLDVASEGRTDTILSGKVGEIASDIGHTPVGEGRSSGMHSSTAVQADHDPRRQVLKVRRDLQTALHNIFEGVKTGQALRMTLVHQAAETLIGEITRYPELVTEVMLLDALDVYDKPLYAHSLDVALLGVLVGLQMEWGGTLLHEIAVAGLLHDVGFIRLPAHIVKDQWADQGSARLVLRQHVNVGVALIRQHAKGSSLVHRFVGEHHERVDGSGYPRKLTGDSLSEAGQLLGMVDYFDELISIWGNPVSLPPVLALRRIFKETHEGRFPSRMGEALVRTLGVFPVGTFVKLTSGEVGVVVAHQPQAGTKPALMLIYDQAGKPLTPFYPVVLGEASPSGQEIAVKQILHPGNVDFDLRGAIPALQGEERVG